MGEWFKNFFTVTLPDFALKFLIAGAVVGLGFLLVNLLMKLIKKTKWFGKIDTNAQAFIANFISVALKVLIIVSAVFILGVPQSSIVALIGACGVAIGLALQGGLSNIAGGLVIMICKPFHVGDYIEAPTVSGFVRDISIYYTKVTTADNIDYNVPNSQLSNATVKNLSTEELRRVDFDFNISYESDIDKARKVLLATAAVNEKILKDPAPEVYIVSHESSSLKIRLRIWCESANYWDVYFAIWEDAKKAMDKFNIEIPYQHINVIVDNK